LYFVQLSVSFVRFSCAASNKRICILASDTILYFITVTAHVYLAQPARGWNVKMLQL
jgi:hypothetical protein